jgi:hypothetical protein
MNKRDKAGSLNYSRRVTGVPVPKRDRAHRSAESRTLRSALSVFAAVAAGSLGLLAFTSDANAQEWTKDRRFGDGKGYRTGDVELHPGIGGEIGYDSNYFLRADGTDARNVNSAPAAPVRDGGILRITPSLTFNTAMPTASADGTPVEQPKFGFRGGLAATYYEFFGPKELSDQRNLSANANVRFDILQNRPVGGALFAGYNRILKPSVDGIADNSFNRNVVNAGGELILMPGGGTFDIRGGYKFTGEFFEQTNGVPFTNYQHEISIRDRWRFRPRTALFHDTSIGFVTYPNKSRSANLLQDSTPLTTRFGITGLLTPRFSLLAAAGYGTTLSLNASSGATQQYDSVIGQAEATFYLSSNPTDLEPGTVSLSVSTLTFGYTRDFQKSFIGGGYYGSDRGYTRLAYFFANKALISLDGNVGAVEYNDIYQNVPTGAPLKISSGFTDVRVGTTLFGEYRIFDSLGVNATLDYSQNFSSHVLDFNGAGGGGGAGSATATRYDMSWKRFQGFLGVRYFL